MREIVSAKTLRQPRAADFGIGELVELARIALRLRVRGADGGAEAWQDQHIRRLAAFGSDELLEIRIERARRCFLQMCREHRLRMTRGKFLPRIRGARLDENGAA